VAESGPVVNHVAAAGRPQGTPPGAGRGALGRPRALRDLATLRRSRSRSPGRSDRPVPRRRLLWPVPGWRDRRSLLGFPRASARTWLCVSWWCAETSRSRRSRPWHGPFRSQVLVATLLASGGSGSDA